MHHLVPIQNVLVSQAQDLTANQFALLYHRYDPVQGVEQALELFNIAVDKNGKMK